jgi:sulfate permease, SulP family
MSFALDYDWNRGRRDVLAGLTVAAIAVPEGMAYALIAGVDPKFGLYSMIVVTAVASILGSSSHLINGPTSAISLLVFGALSFLDPENRTDLFEAMFFLGFLIGTFQILIAVFRLGDLTRYISESVIIGFMLGAAFLLAIGQIAGALGMHNKGNGHMQVLERLWLTLFHGDHINFKAVLLSAVAIVLALLFRSLVRRYKLPRLDMLLVLVVTGLIAYFAGWSVAGSGGETAIEVAGKIPSSFPTVHVPIFKTSWLPDLSQSALAIAFVGVIEALSIAKAIAHETGQKIDYNRQIIAEGIANLTGAFFQSLPGSGSLSRSAINYQAGAATRFSGIVTAAASALALLLFAPLLHFVPKPALAGILLLTAARLVDFKRLVYTLKVSRYDAALAIITAVTAIAINLDTAVLLGIALSILFFVPRAAKLKASELIVTPDRVVRERVASDPVDPRLIIYDLEGELFFGAAPELDRYLDTLEKRVAEQNAKFVVLRLKRARNPDVVCIERLDHFLREQNAHGVTVLLAGVRDDTLRALHNIGFDSWFPSEQVFPEEDKEYSATLKAVRHAYAKLGAIDFGAPNAAAEESDQGAQAKLYYLV